MGLFKTAVIAAAAYGVYRLLTDRDELTGNTVLEDFCDKAGEWTDEAKSVKNKIVEDVSGLRKEFSNAVDGDDL